MASGAWDQAHSPLQAPVFLHAFCGDTQAWFGGRSQGRRRQLENSRQALLPGDGTHPPGYTGRVFWELQEASGFWTHPAPTTLTSAAEPGRPGLLRSGSFQSQSWAPEGCARAPPPGEPLGGSRALQTLAQCPSRPRAGGINNLPKG